MTLIGEGSQATQLGFNIVLGAIADEWAHFNGMRRNDLLLNANQFNREVSREKIRSTRRGIPFCVVSIRLNRGRNLKKRRKTLIRFLHGRVRMTDHKARLAANKFALLLVDTGEMGGRCVVDRIEVYAQKHALDLTIDFKPHHTAGFGDDDSPSGPSSGQDDRRVDLAHNSRWLPMEGSEGVLLDESSQRPILKMTLKRAVDLVGGGLGLLAVSPILLGAMSLVKLTSPGPAIFSQTREGRGGKPFTIYKIRTMVVDAESQQDSLRSSSHRDGPAFKVNKDPRVTWIGRILRATCVDELPQLWNVLRGEMSLVGPRPLPWQESRACSAWQRRRLDVRPGMTCYWQVDKDKAETFDDWMRLDLKYVDSFNFFRDLGLIVRTFVVPLTGQGSK